MGISVPSSRPPVEQTAASARPTFRQPINRTRSLIEPSLSTLDRDQSLYFLPASATVIPSQPKASATDQTSTKWSAKTAVRLAMSFLIVLASSPSDPFFLVVK